MKVYRKYEPVEVMVTYWDDDVVTDVVRASGGAGEAWPGWDVEDSNDFGQ